MTFELRTSVDIDATPERVWQVLTDLPAYSSWNPFITHAEGSFAVGERLSFTLPPVNALLRITLRPTVLEATPCRRLRLRSRQDRLGLPGLFDAEHAFTITPRDGGVRLWQEQRLHGLFVPLMTRSLNRHRLPALNAMNAALKDRCEGGAPATPRTAPIDPSWAAEDRGRLPKP
jgi:hypothetical protein